MILARILKTFQGGNDSAPFTLDLHIEAGQGITVLFGPSGSGKTLSLDCIAGFINPDSGRILMDDAIVFDSGAGVSLRPQERRCGYVFQNYALFPHMTLRQNLLFAAARSRRAERMRRVHNILERFHLTDLAGRKPHELSGGQKQRGSIARALISAPRVLLLDEPARGLDAPLRAELYEILHQVRREFETPMLLVTHSLEECLELGDQMVVLAGGRVVQQGPPADVCSRPATLEVAQLLGAFNLIPAEIRTLDPSRNSSLLRIGEYEIESEYWPGHLKGDRIQLLVTPRQLHALPRAGRLGPNQIPAELVRSIVVPDGVRLEFSGGLSVEMPEASDPRNNGDWVIQFPVRGLRII